MKKIEIPEKLLNLYLNTGILGIGEYHGVKENYIFYETLLESLPEIPNLAIEMKETERIEFEKFLNGEKIDESVLSNDGRLNLEFFNFLKRFTEKYPDKEIINFDEKDKNIEELKKLNKTRDEQMADNLISNIKKPLVIIAGNLHLQKNIINLGDRKIVTMGYLIKERIGDYPFISVVPLKGENFNFGINKLETIEDRNKNEFYEKEDNKFLFFLENATPTTPFQV